MRIVGTAWLAGFVASVSWLTSSCTEDERNTCEGFEDETSGQWVVEHPETGRLWLRCPVGQEFDHDSCSCEGDISLMTLNDAMEACPAGFTWRARCRKPIGENAGRR